jgi:hypothetical protein
MYGFPSFVVLLFSILVGILNSFTTNKPGNTKLNKSKFYEGVSSGI